MADPKSESTSGHTSDRLLLEKLKKYLEEELLNPLDPKITEILDDLSANHSDNTLSLKYYVSKAFRLLGEDWKQVSPAIADRTKGGYLAVLSYAQGCVTASQICLAKSLREAEADIALMHAETMKTITSMKKQAECHHLYLEETVVMFKKFTSSASNYIKTIEKKNLEMHSHHQIKKANSYDESDCSVDC